MENLDLAGSKSETLECHMWEKYPYWKNVFNRNLDQYFSDIFRVETFDDFKSNIEKNVLFFRHPNEWLEDDRYDSFLLRLKIILPDGTELRQGYLDSTFCQCWSTEDSKRMWDKHAKDKDKIYIKMVSNIDSIMRAFDDTSVFKGYSASFWAGAVNYSDFDATDLIIHLKTDEEVREFFCFEFIVNFFLEKRSDYAFEKEIRFIASHQNDRKKQPFVLIDLKKSLPEILKGIIIDPRLNNKNQIAMITDFAQSKRIKILESNC